MQTAAHLLKNTFIAWWQDDVFRLASSLAFYTIFSLAPILLISVGVASLIFSREQAQTYIVEQIVLLTGGEGGQVARQVLKNAGDIGANPRAIAGAVIALIAGSTAVFANLQSALNQIWKVEAAPNRSLWKGFLRDRMRSFGIVLSVGFLLMVSMVLSASLTAVHELLSNKVQGISWVWETVNFFLSLGIITLLFALIYKYLPDVQIAWADVFVGALITSFFFGIGKFLIGLYLGQVAIGSTYGAAGSFVVFLIWVYYSSLICFFGAEFVQVYARKHGTRIKPEPHAVLAEEPEKKGRSPREKKQ